MIKYEQKLNFFNFPLFFISQLNNNINSNNNEYEKLKILYNEEKKNSIIYKNNLNNLNKNYKQLYNNFILLKNININNEIKKINLLKDLCELNNNFELALNQINNNFNKKINKNIFFGFKLIHNKLETILNKNNIIKIFPIPLTTNFNPKFHEAISTKSIKNIENNKIIKVLNNGYKYKNKILIPSKVYVNIINKKI